MSTTIAPLADDAAFIESALEMRLLHSAHDRKLRSLWMTLGASTLIAAFTWEFLPAIDLVLWIASIWFSAGLGFLEVLAFRRAAIQPQQVGRWKAIFLFQAAIAGISWTLGPCLMIQDASGAALALFTTILVAVCTVATISLVEQRAAMVCFVTIALVPPALLLGYTGGTMERLVALALFVGMVLEITVGSHLHQSLRDLMESEGRTSAILDTALDAFVEINAQGQITDWNRRAEAIFGWKRNEIVGQGIVETIIPQDERAVCRQQLAEFIASAAKMPPTQKTELTAMNKDGVRFPVALAISALQTRPERRFAGFISDITERKQAEEALEENREKYRALSEAASEAIFISENGRCIEQNKQAQEIFGYSDAQAIGRMGTEWIAPQDRELVLQHMLCGVEVPYEALGLRKDGSTFPAMLHGRMMQYKGRTVRATIMGDLTDRKRAEEEQRIAATAFESQQGIIITDAQKVIVRVNHAFSQITGYAAAEVVGRTARMLDSDRHDRAFYEDMTTALERKGIWDGEIWSRRKSGEVYPERRAVNAVTNHAGVTTHYVYIFSDISEQFRAQAEIDSLAFYDPLTRLPNRRRFLDRLAEALAVSSRGTLNYALLLIDLDNFKMLNDTLGHQQGDLVLVQVAQRLKTCIRDGDMVARLGGDEFVVLLQNLSEDAIEAATQAEAVSSKILQSFETDFRLDAGMHHGAASIGVTLFGGDMPESSEQPLKQAELAMFKAKASGRATLRFFDMNMQAEVTTRSTLDADLREAVQQQQFELYYQPQVVGTGRIIGVEALLRWNHPTRGMVLPADFIAQAEENGLILPIGQWVLDQACSQLAKWANEPGFSNLTIAVNVSVRQFQSVDFAESVLATLARTHARPRLLKLELTESMVVDHVEDVIARMGVLKSKGVGFSLDDFGTGYSSLSYLKRLPLDQLKIDQSFVHNIVTDPNDAAIAKMVVALAESMGLAVIAEGVEMQAQIDYLAHLGCHAYQGFMFSRPLALNGLQAFVLANT